MYCDAFCGHVNCSMSIGVKFINKAEQNNKKKILIDFGILRIGLRFLLYNLIECNHFVFDMLRLASKIVILNLK